MAARASSSSSQEILSDGNDSNNCNLYDSDVGEMSETSVDVVPIDLSHAEAAGKISSFAILFETVVELKNVFGIRAVRDKRIGIPHIQKYNGFPVFLLENLKQLTHNSYLEANLALFCPTLSFC